MTENNILRGRVPSTEWLDYARVLGIKYYSWDFDSEYTWFEYIDSNGDRALQVDIDVSLDEFKEHMKNGTGYPSFFATCESDEVFEKIQEETL